MKRHPAFQPAPSSKPVQNAVQAALFSALTCILAYVVIPLPFSPVPVSGQTLAIMLSGLLLGPKWAATSQLVYLVLGALGLPVFHGGASGPGVLFGPTGGYLWGFVLGAYVTGYISARDNKMRTSIWALIVGGVVVIYIAGVLQLMIVARLDFIQAVTVGMLPFLPGDLFKVAVAALLGRRVRTIRRHTR